MTDGDDQRGSVCALGLWYGWPLLNRQPAARTRDHASSSDLESKIEPTLTEARMVLPGAQALDGFQFVAFFATDFVDLPRASRLIHVVGLVLVSGGAESMRLQDMTINLLKLPTFSTDELFHVVVESPRDSAIKLKYNPTFNAMSISRPLALGLRYPYDWGFVPSTKGPDGDPVDALVYWDVTTFPGVVIPCRALAVMQVEQNREGHPGQRVRNDRVIAVPNVAKREAADFAVGLPERVRDELAHFFLATTVLENKDLRILGWDRSEAALSLIRQAST